MRPAFALAALLALAATPAAAELGPSCTGRVTLARIDVQERTLPGGGQAARYWAVLSNPGHDAMAVALRFSRPVTGRPADQRVTVEGRSSERLLLGDETLSGAAPDQSALRAALTGMCRAAPAQGTGR